MQPLSQSRKSLLLLCFLLLSASAFRIERDSNNNDDKTLSKRLMRIAREATTQNALASTASLTSIQDTTTDSSKLASGDTSTSPSKPTSQDTTTTPSPTPVPRDPDTSQPQQKDVGNADNSRYNGLDDGVRAGNETVLTIWLDNHGDSVVVNWHFSSNDTEITGFLVKSRSDDGEDYDSPKLSTQARAFNLHSLHADQAYSICVEALVNNTAILDACVDWSEASLKVVVGIMAGIVFLIPCVAVLIWILKKDRHMRKKMTEEDEEPLEEKLIEKNHSGLEDHKKHHGHEGHDLKGHDHMGHQKRRHPNSKKVMRDEGHEHYCYDSSDEAHSNPASVDGVGKLSPTRSSNGTSVTNAMKPCCQSLIHNGSVAAVHTHTTGQHQQQMAGTILGVHDGAALANTGTTLISNSDHPVCLSEQHVGADGKEFIDVHM